MSEEIGSCDYCDATYYVWDDQHCGECGTCFSHCDCNDIDDSSDDSYVLASIGWGTDEDYGYYGD